MLRPAYLRFEFEKQMTAHVFRSLPLLADSRTKRNASIFASPDSVTYTWEKQPDQRHAENVAFPFSKQGSKLAKLVKLLVFVCWVGYSILFKAKRGDVAVFMDLETALFGIPAARLKGVRAIFDIVDPCAQTKIRAPALQNLVDRLEVAVGRCADDVLLPHPIRLTYYADRGLTTDRFKQTRVIENVPQFVGEQVEISPPALKGAITIGYFGTLDRNSRGLEWLIGFVGRYPEHYRLVLAGNGALAEEMAAIASRVENIEFHGIYSPRDLAKLYQLIDFTWAYYSPRIDLHRYAAPNKFYEHLYFTRPIITSSVIPQFALIRELNSGLSVDAEEFSEASFEQLHAAVSRYCRDGGFDSAAVASYWKSHYHEYYLNAAAAQRVPSHAESRSDCPQDEASDTI